MLPCSITAMRLFAPGLTVLKTVWIAAVPVVLSTHNDTVVTIFVYHQNLNKKIKKYL